MSSRPIRVCDLTCEVISWPGIINLNTIVFLSSREIRPVFLEALAQPGNERLGLGSNTLPPYTLDAVKSRTRARVDLVGKRNTFDRLYGFWRTVCHSSLRCLGFYLPVGGGVSARVSVKWPRPCRCADYLERALTHLYLKNLDTCLKHEEYY